MKKLSTIIIAAALLMGMAQCKKQETPASEGNVVRITLNVGGNGNGSRVNVDPYPTSGDQVTFENGDQIVVASNGAVVGTLTKEGEYFTGDITNAMEGQPLYFYFLGNKQGTVDNGVTTCTVNISDQTTDAGLPVISMGASTADYSSEVTSYESRLKNKCSLQKFNVTTTSHEAICITGMNNTVTVNFGTPTAEYNGFSYGKDGDGLIKMLAGVDNVTWAIVLPQAALEAGAAGSAYTADNACTGIRPAIHEIERNKFYEDAIELVLNAASTAPEGAINGKFTINGDNGQVYFSQGNLQYQASTNTWQFAEHQYDYVGSANSSISQTNSGWIDLFGWGTSGYNHGATCYQPWSTSTNNSDYYAYGNSGKNLFDAKDDGSMQGQADWGYNAISNGGNQSHQWRTLTQSEWDYVFNRRNTTSGIRFAKAQVAGVNGVILLPDDWSTSYYSLTSPNQSGASFMSNVIGASAWTNNLQSHGALFLPAAGYRYGASVNGVGSGGYYWSASYFDSYNAAWDVNFNDGSLYTDFFFERRIGQSVRLVCPAE